MRSTISNRLKLVRGNRLRLSAISRAARGLGLPLLLTLSYSTASAQERANTGEIRIDRKTAEACTDAFEEVKLSRRALSDLEARATSAERALDLAERLAASETKRADAEAKSADAQAARAEALQLALDASKAVETAKDEQIRVRTEERDFWKGKYKKERRGKFLAIGGLVISVASRIFF